MEILVLKTGALGDVLRTTSILPGLHLRYPGARVTWLTATGARDLLLHHPLVARVVTLEPDDPGSLETARGELGGTSWERVLSFDDEEPLCALAQALGGDGTDGVLTGAYLDSDGRRRYTPDSAPWFDLGLVSVYGRIEADRLKAINRESHPALFARMLGIEVGEPELPLPAGARAFAAEFVQRHGLEETRPLIGLNTGAGGRWESKRLPVERTVALVSELARRLGGAAAFVLLGGPDEAQRNAAIRSGIPSDVRIVDAGTRNTLLEFAALIGRLDLLVTSDSLALHLGISQRVPILAFFAPTSAAEIELYGRGDKVASTAPDACSYRSDADTSTLTVERLADAAARVLRRTS